MYWGLLGICFLVAAGLVGGPVLHTALVIAGACVRPGNECDMLGVPPEHPCPTAYVGVAPIVIHGRQAGPQDRLFALVRGLGSTGPISLTMCWCPGSWYTSKSRLHSSAHQHNEREETIRTFATKLL